MSRAHLIAATVLVASVIGCSTSDEPSVSQSAAEVETLFKTSGVQLLRTDERTDLLGETVRFEPRKDDRRVRRRFGEFTVSVLDIEKWRELGFWEGDLTEVEWEEHVWEGIGPKFGPYWSASRFYGGNVHVIWRSPERRLDERWQRLHSLLSQLDE